MNKLSSKTLLQPPNLGGSTVKFPPKLAHTKNRPNVAKRGKVSQPREPTTSSFTRYHPFKHSNARLECLRTRLRKRALRKSSTGWVAIVGSRRVTRGKISSIFQQTFRSFEKSRCNTASKISGKFREVCPLRWIFRIRRWIF